MKPNEVAEFVANANPTNLAIAKAKVEETLATNEQTKAYAVYSALKSDEELCESEIKKYTKFLVELKAKIKPFEVAKLPKKVKAE